MYDYLGRFTTMCVADIFADAIAPKGWKGAMMSIEAVLN